MRHTRLALRRGHRWRCRAQAVVEPVHVQGAAYCAALGRCRVEVIGEVCALRAAGLIYEVERRVSLEETTVLFDACHRSS